MLKIHNCCSVQMVLCEGKPQQPHDVSSTSKGCGRYQDGETMNLRNVRCFSDDGLVKVNFECTLVMNTSVYN